MEAGVGYGGAHLAIAVALHDLPGYELAEIAAVAHVYLHKIFF
jgi:hypothetical protein